MLLTGKINVNFYWEMFSTAKKKQICMYFSWSFMMVSTLFYVRGSLYTPLEVNIILKLDRSIKMYSDQLTN